MLYEFMRSFSKINEVIEREKRFVFQGEEGEEITGRQLMALADLRTVDHPLSLHEAARECGGTRQAMKRLCQRLEALGLVHLQPDPSDHRKNRIVLTEAGFGLSLAVSDHLYEVSQRYYQSLSERDMASFVKVIDVITQDAGYISTFRYEKPSS